MYNDVVTAGRTALSTALSDTKGNVYSDSNITSIQIGKGGINTSTLIYGDITASANISSSGNLYGDSLYLGNQKFVDYYSPTDEFRINGSNTKVQFWNQFETNGAITASAAISASGGTSTFSAREYEISSTTTNPNNYNGDIVTFGAGPGGVDADLQKGYLYYYSTDRTWELTRADDENKVTGLLAICVKDATVEMLIKGTNLDGQHSNVGGDAAILYVSDTSAGEVTATRPSSTGDFVRIVGYCINATERLIWFNPDSTYVKV